MPSKKAIKEASKKATKMATKKASNKASKEEKAKQNHPVPAEMLLQGMKAVVVEGKEKEFLDAFAGSFALLEESDIDKFKDFLKRHRADENEANMAARTVIGTPRCPPYT